MKVRFVAREDAADAYFQAPEKQEVVVEPAAEYRDRLVRSGKHTHVVWSACGGSGRHIGFCGVHCRATVLLEQHTTGCVGIAHGRHFLELHTRVGENKSSRIYRDRSSSNVVTGANGENGLSSPRD